MPYIVLGYRRVTRAVLLRCARADIAARRLPCLRPTGRGGSPRRGPLHSVISASTSISIIIAGSTSRVISTMVEAGRMT